MHTLHYSSMFCLFFLENIRAGHYFVCIKINMLSFKLFLPKKLHEKAYDHVMILPLRDLFEASLSVVDEPRVCCTNLPALISLYR